MDGGQPWRPKLASRARLKFDKVANQEMLLFPEAALVLNETGAAIVRLCDGQRSLEQIVDELTQNFADIAPAALRREVENFLVSIRERGLLQ